METKREAGAAREVDPERGLPILGRSGGGTGARTSSKSRVGGATRQARVSGYHLFQRGDRHFVYDLCNNQFFRLAMICWDALRGLQSASPEPEVWRPLAERYGREAAGAARHELAQMRHHGFLREWYTPEPVTEADVQRIAMADSGSIQINIAQSCNLSCRYCYLAAVGGLGGGLMKEDVGRAAVDLAFRRSRSASSQGVNITFFGGEPLLNKPLLKALVVYALEKGTRENKSVTFCMTTNGTLLDDGIIALIKQHNFGLMISIDGGREGHDRMRPYADGRPSFDDIVDNVKRLRRARRQITARVTLSRFSADRRSIIEALRRVGFTKIGFGIARGTVEGRGPWDLTEEQEDALGGEDTTLVRWFLEDLEAGQRPPYDPCSGAVDTILKPRDALLRCGVGRGTTTVTEDGKLYPCHRYAGMEAYAIGDIERGIDRGRFKEYLTRYFHARRKCVTCWAQRLCGGPCPWYVSRRDGSMQPAPLSHCNRIRTGLEDAADLLEEVRSRHPAYYRELASRHLEACGVDEQLGLGSNHEELR